MNGRRAIVGLCMSCALLTSAFAAQSASAITGTTAVTCKKGAGDTGGATFTTAHCLPGESGSGFGHYEIKPNTTTEAKGQAGSATTRVKSLVAGTQTTLTSTSLTVTGSIENKVAANGEHYFEESFETTYSNMTIGPFTKCFVYEDNAGAIGTKETVNTQKLTATTAEQGMGVKITPNEGTVLMRFYILDKNKKTSGEGGECTIAGTYNVTGSVLATPEGATFSTTHEGVTTQNTLKMGTGAEPTIKAGIEGSLTMEGSAKGAGTFNPISFTTYST